MTMRDVPTFGDLVRRHRRDAGRTYDLPTGTVTFLFTDIEGSTRLLHTLGDRYTEVLATHYELLRAAAAAHGGTEVGSQGDALFFAFPRARDALAAATAAQRVLATHAWPEGVAVHVRMGLHTGEPLVGPTGYVGMDVHRAARIAAAGHGGQVLLSAATRELIEHDLQDGMTLLDLGEHRLKDLQRGEHITQLVCEGLPVNFPPLESLDARPNNLPVQPAALLGREQMLAAICALLRRADVRLVTLTGPGGIGKTRLAIQVAAELLVDYFADGVWFVRLSHLSDPALVLPTIAQTLGLRESGGQPIAEVLWEYLRNRELLLVLDNFEQIVAAAPEVGRLLESPRRLKVLVTSRVPLHLRGEHECTVAPLALPDRVQATDLESLWQYPAVALFIQRAREVKSDFAVTAANAPAIVEICARLDGLPLAIELAAARVKLLPPETLLARLSSSLKLLTGGARDLEERQRTMQATITWSENLLSPEEEVLFRRLSVFVGGYTLEAAEAVCVAPDGAKPLKLDLLDGLGALVDQSLVQVRDEGGEPRFGMLHVIRDSALERLDESGETVALRRAHAVFYVTLAEQMRPQLEGPDQAELFERMERDHDNLRAELEWSLEHEAAEMASRLCTALHPFWNMSGHWTEEGHWVARTLSLGDALPPRLRAHLLSQAGNVATLQGDFAAATKQLDQSLALFRSMDDKAGSGNVLRLLAVIALGQEQFEQAERLFEESLNLLQEAGDRIGALQVLRSQASLHVARGEYTAGSSLLKQALALAQSLGYTHDIAECGARLGWLALLRGDVDAAKVLIYEALTVQQQLRDANCTANSLGYLSMLALEQGDAAAARGLCEQSLALFEKIAKQPDIAGILVWLGAARFAAGDVQGAEDAYLKSLRIERMRIERGFASRQRTAACLESLAELALARGQPDLATRLLGAASKVLGEIVSAPLPPRLAAQRERVAVDVRHMLGEEARAAAFAAGQALSLEAAITLAMGAEDGELAVDTS